MICCRELVLSESSDCAVEHRYGGYREFVLTPIHVVRALCTNLCQRFVSQLNLNDLSLRVSFHLFFRHFEPAFGGLAYIGQRFVERVAFGKCRDQERGGAVQAALDGRAGAVLPGHQAHQRVQLRGKRGRGFGGKVESEELDGQRSIGLGMHRAKYRTTRAGADLVQDTKAADGRRWNVEQRTFPGHVLTGDLTTRS